VTSPSLRPDRRHESRRRAGFRHGSAGDGGATYSPRHDVADDAPDLAEPRRTFNRAALPRGGHRLDARFDFEHLWTADQSRTHARGAPHGSVGLRLHVSGLSRKAGELHDPHPDAGRQVPPDADAHGSISGGPAITQLAGETSVGPAGTARLVQVFQIGTASLDYTRAVSTAGGLGGTNDTQIFSAGLVFPTWYRGLVVAFTPSYRIATSVSRAQPSQVDVKALTVPLVVNYQIARYTSVFASTRSFSSALAQPRRCGTMSIKTASASVCSSATPSIRMTVCIERGRTSDIHAIWCR